MSHTDKRQMPVWQESLLLVVTALVMAVIVKAFFVQAFYIPSESMEPGLLVNDKILVQKPSYWLGEPHRGDVVVFDDPGGWLDESSSTMATNPLQKTLEMIGLFPTGGHLIKRVIGVGGDHIVCCDPAGRLEINGTSIDEPYTLATPGATSELKFDVKVPAGHLWVMGDNRGNSADSRVHLGDPGGGFVDVNRVVGKSWLRVWPLDRIGFAHRPHSFDNVGP